MSEVSEERLNVEWHDWILGCNGQLFWLKATWSPRALKLTTVCDRGHQAVTPVMNLSPWSNWSNYACLN